MFFFKNFYWIPFRSYTTIAFQKRYEKLLDLLNLNLFIAGKGNKG